MTCSRDMGEPHAQRCRERFRRVLWAMIGAAALWAAPEPSAAAGPGSAPPPRPAGLDLAAAPPATERTAALRREDAGSVGSGLGPVTGLPMPRYVSLRAGEGNARRGPALTHRVDWVFTRRDMPLKVTAEFGHWRRVEDAEGVGGWMHFALLSGARTVLVLEEMTPLHLQADARAPVVGRLEAGVIARVLSCGGDWCRLRADRLRGWAPRDALWGVAADETID